ncbi:MAG: L-aspartate oxidase [Candidatus Sumerlaeia bacterium]|nr:L-aspartate oxidase [Candidatus Sumerlaeia bacterium]
METDLLIIGAGAAGATCALRAADLGLDVVLIANCEELPGESNTRWAQGGIVYSAAGDSPERLAADIQAAGCGICLPEAVEQLALEGPRLVREVLLDRCGVPFDRGASGALDLTEEGAHSLPRIIHVKDTTGRAIAEGLHRAVAANPRIRVLTGATAVDLIMRGYHSTRPTDVYKRDRCLGAYVLKDDRVEPITARETVLATGGLGQIYLHTTNPPTARGDGVAIGYRAGARMVNLEYIQFHPTAFYHRLAPRHLLSEAMRGEGARLVTAKGDAFMPRYSDLGDLAPRDVVARAIHEELLRSGDACVFLDLTHLDPSFVRARFPANYEFCLEFGVDMTREPVPVVPAAHYSCGGIGVDLAGHTNIAGLRAVGEVSCTGVHGANRLASTSLLEALTWGWLAAEGVASETAENPVPNAGEVQRWRLESESADPALLKQDWMTIKATMWNHVGLVRTTQRMNRALRILRELQFEVETFYRRARLTDELLGLRNGAQAALAVVHAALRNRVSRGAHYRI